MNGNKLYLYIKILGIFGISLAIFLLWEQFFHPAFKPCSINATVNCDAIISGSVSKTLGIPTALYGLLGYIIIVIAAFIQKEKLLLYTAGFGLLFCLWIAYQELFLLKVICPICIGCQVIMLSTFILTILLNTRKKQQSV